MCLIVCVRARVYQKIRSEKEANLHRILQSMLQNMVQHCMQSNISLPVLLCGGKPRIWTSTSVNQLSEQGCRLRPTCQATFSGSRQSTAVLTDVYRDVGEPNQMDCLASPVGDKLYVCVHKHTRTCLHVQSGKHACTKHRHVRNV